MLIEALAIASAVLAGPMQKANTYSGERSLATVRPYPQGRADDVRRPLFNGRVWQGRPIIGGVHTGYPVGWPDPGPEAYGAIGHEQAAVYAIVEHQVIAISPWVRLEGRANIRLEHARQEWLAERGYIGGVRTFVNDAYVVRGHDAGDAHGEDAEGGRDHANAGEKTNGKKIEPRGVIELAPDVPRFKSRMQVNGAKQRKDDPRTARTAVAARPVTKVVPMSNPGVEARLAAEKAAAEAGKAAEQKVAAAQ